MTRSASYKRALRYPRFMYLVIWLPCGWPSYILPWYHGGRYPAFRFPIKFNIQLFEASINYVRTNLSNGDIVNQLMYKIMQLTGTFTDIENM